MKRKGEIERKNRRKKEKEREKREKRKEEKEKRRKKEKSSLNSQVSLPSKLPRVPIILFHHVTLLSNHIVCNSVGNN